MRLQGGHRFVALCVLAFLLVSSALSIPSCSNPPPPKKPERSPLYGGTLTIRLASDPSVISPLANDRSARMVSQLLFSGLTRLNSHLLPVPDLADSWEISPDELNWTFHLRQGLKWHDGVPLTADDVLFTFQTLSRLEPTNATEFDIKQVVSRVEKIDSSTVKIVLRRRYAPLAAHMSIPILPQHILRAVAPADIPKRTVTVGSGPFKFVERKPQQSIVLEANPSYYQGRPYIDKVAFLITNDDGVAQKALQDGQLMLAEFDKGGSDDLAKDTQIEANEFSESGFFFVGFNLRKGKLFEDKNLRQAWAYGIDKAELVKTATKNRGIPLWSDIPPVSWAYDPTVPTIQRDVAKAKQLLASSGWTGVDSDGIAVKGGQKLTVDLLVRNDAPDRVEAARLMAQQLKEVGFGVKVVGADFGSVLAAKRKPPFDFDAILMGWTLNSDPDDYRLFHSSQIPNEKTPDLLNFVGFANEEFDQLTNQERGTLDVKKREELYRGTQRILAQEMPYYFLWANKILVAYNKRLQGPIELTSPAYLWNVEKWHINRS